MYADDMALRGSLLTLEISIWETRAAVCRERRWKDARAGRAAEHEEDLAVEVGLAAALARRRIKRVLWGLRMSGKRCLSRAQR